MDRCEEIVANVKMEECYAGLSLVFDESRKDLKDEIEEAIEKVCSETKLKPLVFDNKEVDKEGHEAYYIEFTDEAQRESGEFFASLLKRLRIDKCVNDIISQEDAKC